MIKGESVTTRFAWWGGDDRHTATLKAIEEYQKINRNVKIGKLSIRGTTDTMIRF